MLCCALLRRLREGDQLLHALLCIVVFPPQGYAGSTAQQCGQIHSVDDPQFAGSASFAGYVQVNNHEIDIEIPANCENTPNVCKDGSCAGDYSTVNLNNYIMSNNGGIGQAYTNMCVKVA